MKKLIVNNQKYILPENYSELKIGIYEKLQNLPLEKEEETDYKVKYLSILSKTDESILSQVEREDLYNLWALTGWLSEEPKPGKLKQLFELNGKQYFFNVDLREETVYQAFVDAFEILNSAPTFWHVAPGVLATIIRPVKKIEYQASIPKLNALKGREKFNKENYIKHIVLEDYDSANVDKHAEDLKEMSCQEVSSIFFYLIRFSEALSKEILLRYSNDVNQSPLLRAKIKEQLHLLNRLSN